MIKTKTRNKMDNDNSVIYGLEFQARALAPQLAETEKIKFIIGTQSLKQANNQIHLVEFNEEISTIKTSVFHHSDGEIWRITTSPIDSTKLSTCYNSVTNESSCMMKTAILKLPETENPNTIEDLEVATKLETSLFGSDIKTTDFHPTESNKAVSVTENQIILWDISGEEGKNILNIQLEGKNNPKFTTGKWNPHQNCNQFTTATETHLKTYDVRSGDLAWNIDGVHSQLLRDIDFNMNKQYHIATCGDDGFVKIWDFRQTNQPVFSRSDHSHWVWCVRFNHFHDQLLLTASSDARVFISSAASVSSENNSESCITDETDGLETKQMYAISQYPNMENFKVYTNLAMIGFQKGGQMSTTETNKKIDGPLQWCEHEDSVYCAEWSPAEPWVFASLSYDGRLLISRVKKSLKYQIML